MPFIDLKSKIPIGYPPEISQEEIAHLLMLHPLHDVTDGKRCPFLKKPLIIGTYKNRLHSREANII